MNLVRIISSELNTFGQRIIKVLRYGRNDVQTPLQASSFGVDSNPIKDMVAVYAPTEEKGKTVIIGYLNQNQIANVGENRIFSTDSDGNVVMFLHLKNDGIAEFGGADDFMVRFNELQTGFDELVNDHNDLVQAFNAHVHPGVTAGAASTLITIAPEVPSAADITSAKIEEIKTL